MSLSANAAGDFARTLTESLPYTQRFTGKTLGYQARRYTAGVNSAHIIDGRVAHIALLDIFSAEGVGTLITKNSTTHDN